MFDLSGVTVAALVYCGGDDEPEYAVPTAKALRTKLRVLDGCDHAATFEAVNRLMGLAIPFLEGISSVEGAPQAS